MSLIGKLIRIEDGPTRDGASWGQPDYYYPTWRLVLTQDNSSEVSVCTGRSDLIDIARPWIGRQVTIARSAKVGIVGGIRLSEISVPCVPSVPTPA